MESFYLSIALVTAGVALLSGSINFFAGLYKEREKTDFIFGVLSLSAFVFLILPPTGFILRDQPPYSVALDIKRIFIWVYYALLPWFIEYYSGYKKRFFNYSVIFLLAFSYVVMLFTEHDRTIWYYCTRLALGLILVQGIAGAVKQIKNNHRKEGMWLLTAMIIYGILLTVSTWNQLANTNLKTLMGIRAYFSLHLNLIAFIIIMSIRLKVNTMEKYKLEKMLHWRDTSWNLLIQNMELMVVELDKYGRISYLNPYAVKKLGYHHERELKDKNWFDFFALKEERDALKTLYNEAVEEGKLLSDLTYDIRSKEDKKLIIRWTNVFLMNPDDSVRGIMSIGMDNTEQTKAFEQIQKLKSELEKENLLLKGEKSDDMLKHGIVGHSDAILYAIQKSKQVAATNAGVLLLGETGTGKELFADLIHRSSYRFNKPLVKVNCTSLPAELIESELFGHEKGSFTGAFTSRKGKFEMAEGGTIFLDEIGELPLSLQPKLLRVLQNGEFEKIGGQKPFKVDVRIIAATNRNLQAEVKAGKFREDLFYRLNVFPISIPPLRKRKGDIPLLVSHFVKKFADDQGKSITEISKADLVHFSEYSWPGNIRELINLIERSVIQSRGPVLHIDWQKEETVPDILLSEQMSMEEVERAHILKVLEDCRWKINGDDGAANRLGLNPSTLRSRLKKLQIERGGA